MNPSAQHRACGFSLIELLVVVSVIGIMLALGAPTYRQWIENAQVRNLAESFSRGLSLARSEAIKRNRAITFQMTDTLAAGCLGSSAAKNWIVSQGSPIGFCSDTAGGTINSNPNTLFIAVSKASPAAAGVTVNSYLVDTSFAVAGAQSAVVFNALGRVNNAIQGGVWIDFTTTSLSTSNSRPLRLTLTQFGQIRLCDPSPLLATDDPRRC